MHTKKCSISKCFQYIRKTSFFCPNHWGMLSNEFRAKVRKEIWPGKGVGRRPLMSDTILKANQIVSSVLRRLEREGQRNRKKKSRAGQRKKDNAGDGRKYGVLVLPQDDRDTIH